MQLRREYNTEDDNIIADLYAPCLRVCKRYDRAVGYFRAGIYRELGEPLLDFAIKGGRTRIVCSPDLPAPEEDAARSGYDDRDRRPAKEVGGSLLESLKAMATNPGQADCLSMLRLLIENKSLDLFVAIRAGGIYHRKIGLFVDGEGSMVVFAGSGNETWSAVATPEEWGNDEEFDVFRSWGEDFEAEKASKKSSYLERLFAGGTGGTTVRPINEIERGFLDQFRDNERLEDCRPGADRRSRTTGRSSRPIAYGYQREAISAWEAAGHSGILAMATGTGKTFTALFAVEGMLREGHPILIVVPSKILLEQWQAATQRFFPGIPVLLAGGGHEWKADDSKRLFVSSMRRPRMIIATIQTASSSDFLEFLEQSTDLVLVADEVHRLGSPNYRRLLDLQFHAKIGLSATPERLFDPDGSAALEHAFGRDPVYDLPIDGKVRLTESDTKLTPILGHFLSPYRYEFETVALSASEQSAWDKLTKEVRKQSARSKAGDDGQRDASSNQWLQTLLFKRARILKKAAGKLEVAARVIGARYPQNGRWLVYCEDQEQMDSVAALLRSQNAHRVVLEYHSGMDDKERNRVLTYFEMNPSIVVCIRCLDEGVDIPATDGALILASSTNPRQYIQRRGRILRKAKGKGAATIIDAIVLPSNDSDVQGDSLAIVRSELARAYRFAQSALNPESSHELWRICQNYGVQVAIDAQGSVEFGED